VPLSIDTSEKGIGSGKSRTHGKTRRKIVLAGAPVVAIAPLEGFTLLFCLLVRVVRQ